jgi:hypothetical protein
VSFLPEHFAHDITLVPFSEANFTFIYLFIFETGSCYVGQADLKLYVAQDDLDLRFSCLNLQVLGLFTAVHQNAR